MRPDSLVVVPVYKEDLLILKKVVEDLKKYFQNILLIDDGNFPSISQSDFSQDILVLNHLVNLGQGAALQSGFDIANRLSGVDIVITFDADGQHQATDAKEIYEFLRIHPQIDIVFGTRQLGSQTEVPKLRQIILKSIIFLKKHLTNYELTDYHNGLRGIRKSVFSRLLIENFGMLHASEISNFVIKNRFDFAEIPVTLKYTPYSIGKGQKNIDFLLLLLERLKKLIKI
jgi:hypothetical protein